MTAKKQSDKMTVKCLWSKGMDSYSYMQKKTAPTDIHWLMLNVSEDQTVDVNTVKRW